MRDLHAAEGATYRCRHCGYYYVPNRVCRKSLRLGGFAYCSPVAYDFGSLPTWDREDD
jgi:hypothetical protein